MSVLNVYKKFQFPTTNVHRDLTLQSWVFLIGGYPLNCSEMKYWRKEKNCYNTSTPDKVYFLVRVLSWCNISINLSNLTVHFGLRYNKKLTGSDYISNIKKVYLRNF